MDATEDDLFDNRSEDAFEGFHASEVEDAEELNTNLQAELVNRDLYRLELDSDSNIDSAHKDDSEYDPGSSGR